VELSTISELFPTQDDCLGYVEAARWPDGCRCPYCGSTRSTRVAVGRRLHCNQCNTSYSATVGTLLHRTHLPLQKWIFALWLAVRANAGLSTRQMARELQVSKSTAARVGHQIRIAMADRAQRQLVLRLIDFDPEALDD
jgi:transposase-like protein